MVPLERLLKRWRLPLQMAGGDRHKRRRTKTNGLVGRKLVACVRNISIHAQATACNLKRDRWFGSGEDLAQIRSSRAHQRRYPAPKCALPFWDISHKAIQPPDLHKGCTCFDLFVLTTGTKLCARFCLFALVVSFHSMFHVPNVPPVYSNHAYSYLGRSEGINTPRATPMNASYF